MCKCKTSCSTYRCDCLKNNQGCNEHCRCVNCHNPLNRQDTEYLTLCALQNIHVVKDLTDEELAKEILLPCECESVPLKSLLGEYDCSKCLETYWFSFCWNDIAQDNCSWHCETCKVCRDWREWHCDQCNRCTYGVSLSCEHCS
jgi:hypothetical protein